MILIAMLISIIAFMKLTFTIDEVIILTVTPFGVFITIQFTFSKKDNHFYHLNSDVRLHNAFIKLTCSIAEVIIFIFPPLGIFIAMSLTCSTKRVVSIILIQVSIFVIGFGEPTIIIDEVIFVTVSPFGIFIAILLTFSTKNAICIISIPMSNSKLFSKSLPSLSIRSSSTLSLQSASPSLSGSPVAQRESLI